MDYDKRIMPIFFVCFLGMPFCVVEVLAENDFRQVRCTGVYPDHLQGICTNGSDAIYWCFTTELVKTDVRGQIIRKVAVADHHGDLCFHDGKVYVAVNLDEFNQPPGRADSWVYCYDAETLAEVKRYPVPEVVHGAGGIAVRDGRFIVVGGLPAGNDENYLYEYDGSMKFRKRHVLASGHTFKGIQTAAFNDGHWWFGCYGNPPELLKADETFQLVGKWDFDCALGVVGLPNSELLVGRGMCQMGKDCTGSIVRAVVDKEGGLRVVRAD